MLRRKKGLRRQAQSLVDDREEDAHQGNEKLAGLILQGTSIIWI
jgi:hypothetical protein